MFCMFCLKSRVKALGKWNGEWRRCYWTNTIFSMQVFPILGKWNWRKAGQIREFDGGLRVAPVLPYPGTRGHLSCASFSAAGKRDELDRVAIGGVMLSSAIPHNLRLTYETPLTCYWRLLGLWTSVLRWLCNGWCLCSANWGKAFPTKTDVLLTHCIKGG